MKRDRYKARVPWPFTLPNCSGSKTELAFITELLIVLRRYSIEAVSLSGLASVSNNEKLLCQLAMPDSLSDSLSDAQSQTCPSTACSYLSSFSGCCSQL